MGTLYCRLFEPVVIYFDPPSTSRWISG